MKVMVKERSVLGGAVLAAFTASLCCTGPLLFVVFGVGTFGAAAVIGPARPFLMGAAVLLLATAFYWAYLKRDRACAPGEACATRPVGRASRVGLWIASLAVLIFALLPYVAAPLAAKISEREATQDCCVAQRPGSAAPVVATGEVKTTTFNVEGRTCASCETSIKLALERTPGVHRAEVSYDRGEAVVEYDPRTTTPERLRDAIASTGYTATEGR
jgi:mercuric ion transport protein